MTTTSVGVSRNWWERPIPMQHRLAKRAVDFGNDPVAIARAFADGPPSVGIFCNVCRLPVQFCYADVSGTATRCWERPSTGMKARDLYEDDLYLDIEDTHDQE